MIIVIFFHSRLKLDSSNIKQLKLIHLKLVECSSIINETLSLPMALAFGISFSLFCIFIFSIFIFPAAFWMNFKGFAMMNILREVHQLVTIMIAIWTCEATTKEQKIMMNEILQTAMSSDDKCLNGQVRKL